MNTGIKNPPPRRIGEILPSVPQEPASSLDEALLSVSKIFALAFPSMGESGQTTPTAQSYVDRDWERYPDAAYREVVLKLLYNPKFQAVIQERMQKSIQDRKVQRENFQEYLIGRS